MYLKKMIKSPWLFFHFLSGVFVVVFGGCVFNKSSECIYKPAYVSNSVGMMRKLYIDKRRTFNNFPRSLHVVLWYPADPLLPKQNLFPDEIWKQQCVVIDAPIYSQEKKLPLILFSHGYGESAYASSWFAEYLASHGYIVACINHYGNTYDNMILELSARPWHRPQDISFVLDSLLNDLLVKSFIDENHIGVAGVSQGGMTALWAAGIVASITKDNLQQHVKRMNIPIFYRIIGKSSKWASIHEHFTEEDFIAANRCYYDSRIKAVFAMAPGLEHDNWAFTEPSSMLKMTMPVHIVVGESDDIVLVKEHAQFFANNILTSTLTILPGKVGHCIFLNEGGRMGKIKNPKRTIDNPSVNRSALHDQVGDLAVSFFNRHLK